MYTDEQKQSKQTLCVVLRTDWRRVSLHAALGHDAMGVGSELNLLAPKFYI